MRTTKRDLQITFEILLGELYGINGTNIATDPETIKEWSLESWSPGDRYGTRYRVEYQGQTPLGSTYWLGKSAAYEGLWTAIKAIRLYKARTLYNAEPVAVPVPDSIKSKCYATHSQYTVNRSTK